MNKTITKLFLFLLVTFFGTNFAWADFSFNEIELKFAQVSDVHTSDAPDTEYKVLSHSKELFCDAIKTINNIKGLDFVIFTGDMVNLPDKNSYRDFFLNLTKLRYPSLLVLGNHDSAINNDSEEYLDKTTVHGVIRKYNPYQNYDNPYFAFSPNPNYRVIVLDTTVGMGAKTSNGFLPDEQLAFLDNEIAQNQDKVILIFQHHPVIEPFKSNDHKLLNAGAYTEIFKKYEKVPIAVFAGHYHASKIVRKGNVIYVASPALVTYPNAFRTVDITDYKDRVIFKFKFHETNLKDIQELSKSGLIAQAAFSGMASDRNDEIMIRKGYVPKEKLTKDEIRAKKLEQKAKKEEMKLDKEKQKQEVKALREAEKRAKQEEKRNKKLLKQQET